MSEAPDDYAARRLHLRRAARAADLRVTIRRTGNAIWVQHVDHEQTEDELWAVADVMDATLRGEQLSWEDALTARARQRLQLSQ